MRPMSKQRPKSRVQQPLYARSGLMSCVPLSFEFGRSWGIRRTEQAKSYVPRPNGHAAIKLFLSGSKRSRLAHEGGDALGVKRRAETSAAYRDGALGSEAVGG